MSAAGLTTVTILDAGFKEVNGVYDSAGRGAKIPTGFVRTCEQMGWDSVAMWKQLYDETAPFYLRRENDAYIYRNKGDGRWWIDGPSGAGVYIVPSDDKLPPSSLWSALDDRHLPLPKVSVRAVPIDLL